MWFTTGSEYIWATLFIGAIVIGLLYEKSHSFRYRFKFGLYILQMSLVATFMIPFICFRPRNVLNIHVGVPFMRPISNFLGIKWKVTGEEILAKDFPCVVICNHQSMLDILAIAELWPIMKKCACIAKREILYVFPFGIMAWLCDTVFINRGNANQSQVALSQSAEKIRENKTKLWIFPEGTRSKKGQMIPFKKGAFHIAVSNKLPIVPVIISPYTFIDDKKKIFDQGTVHVKVLNPIDTSSIEYPDGVSKLVDTCHELMNLEYLKMGEELKAYSETKCTANGNTPARHM